MKRVNNPKFIRLRALWKLAVTLLALGVLFLREPYVPRAVTVTLTLLAGVLVVWQSAADLRRMRPRRRRIVLSVACMALTATFLVMLFVSIDERRNDWRFMAASFAVPAPAAVGGVWSFFRWRRLRAEASEKLFRLRALRRRRSRDAVRIL